MRKVILGLALFGLCGVASATQYCVVANGRFGSCFANMNACLQAAAWAHGYCQVQP